jgi:hypothetical protein
MLNEMLKIWIGKKVKNMGDKEIRKLYSYVMRNLYRA